MFASTRIKSVALAAGLLAAFALSGCGTSAAGTGSSKADSDPDTLVFASVPAEDSTNLDAQFATVAKVIEKETGKKVKFQTATDYAAVIEAQRVGKVQIAAYGPFSYVTAKDSGVGVIPVAYMAKSPEDKGGYQSYGIVPKGSDITDLAGFKGKNVCFVDPTSTSGYLYPSAGLLDAGVDPTKDLTPTFAGGHDASALAVANGQCDAGFAFDTMVDTQLISSGQLKDGDLKVVWKSEMIPSSPVAMLDTLSKGLQAKLVDIFQNKLNVDSMIKNGICSDQAGCALPEAKGWGYKPADDSMYDGIRTVCAITKSESCAK